MSQREHKLAFFKQAGWMLLTGGFSGVFTGLVHIPLTRKLSAPEYGVFAMMMQVLTILAIPSTGLQTILARETAAAVTDERKKELAGAFRALLMLTAGLWIAALLVTAVLQPHLVDTFKIGNPWVIWITMGIIFASLWQPPVSGVLQGRQDFLWLGWTGLFNGFGRFVAVMFIILLMSGQAAGALMGVLLGMGISLLVGLWRCRDEFTCPSSPFKWRLWIGKAIPLTLGLGVGQFIQAADTILIKGVMDENSAGYYGAAGTIARALLAFTGPMVIVMFPKVARQAALSEKSSVKAMALGATALLAAGAAIGLTLFPKLPLLVTGKPEYLFVAPIIPWLAWCMLPLTLANVLISGLMAREEYKCVPWLTAVAALYGFALYRLQGILPSMDKLEAFKLVIRYFGGFSLLLFSVSAWFTWGRALMAKAR